MAAVSLNGSATANNHSAFMPLCPRCQNTVPADAQRCPTCGALVSEHDGIPETGQDTLAAEIRSLLDDGQKIAAIKLYRERTGFGLAEAKAAVEHIGRGASLIRSEAVENDLDE